jgi:hypothetical protein
MLEAANREKIRNLQNAIPINYILARIQMHVYEEFFNLDNII